MTGIGNIDIIAADNPGIPRLLQTGDPDLLPIELRLESGAVLDVSGDKTTAVPIERNVAEVEARGSSFFRFALELSQRHRDELLADEDVPAGDVDLDGDAGQSLLRRPRAGALVPARSDG